MKVYQTIQSVYFLGIGGIGMSALARYFQRSGKAVAGYDRSQSQLLQELRKEGITVLDSQEPKDLPEPFRSKENLLVVYTPAIPSSHAQYRFFLENGYRMEKRAFVLGQLTRGYFTMAVAGTHGKTTTSSLLTHLLKECGIGVTGFLGGISENYQTNLIMDGEEVMVVEADEFDRSFLQLLPNFAAVTSMDADHLDIYGDDAHIKQSFREFAGLIPAEGKLFVTQGLDLRGITIGIGESMDYGACNVKVQEGAYQFDLKTPNGYHSDFELSLPGHHNLTNAMTALAMSLEYGASVEGLRKGLANFKGVRRRFSYRIKRKDLVLIDDYAHHPSEIAAVHQAVQQMHSGKEVLAVFQPHLYSRTRDFAAEFAQSLSLFDEIILVDIYPAREMPLEGVTSEWLLGQINLEKKRLVEKSDLAQVLRENHPQVVVIMGAGDIGEEVETIVKELGK